jgi:hypothetical protein
MKKWVLSVLAAIVATVVSGTIAGWLKPTAIPQVIHESYHPPPSPAPISPADLEITPLRGQTQRGSKAGCLALKENWDFQKKHWGNGSPSARARFDDLKCSQWGIRLE